MANDYDFESETLIDDFNDLMAGEWGRYGSDEWYEALCELAEEARIYCYQLEFWDDKTDAAWLVAKAILALQAQHARHRVVDHGACPADRCSLLDMDPDPDMDDGFGTDRAVT
jgi:hypothetical protein